MKISFISPSENRVGICLIKEDHPTGDAKSLESIQKFVQNIIARLGDAISSTDYSTCPINTGENEEVTYRLYLGEKNPSARSRKENFEFAQKIINETPLPV